MAVPRYLVLPAVPLQGTGHPEGIPEGCQRCKPPALAHSQEVWPGQPDGGVGKGGPAWTARRGTARGVW